MIQESDVSFVLSGGSTNADPGASLGGDPSSTAVPNGIDNLFDDITSNQATAGRTDYRCFYIFNDNGTDTMKGVQVWVDSQVDGGSDVKIGLALHNDVQIISVGGIITAGSVTISLDGHSGVWNYNASLSQWAANLQSTLNALSGITGAAVSASSFGTTATFQVLFQGLNGNKYYPPITIVSNGLTGSTVVAVSKLVDGSPINAVAPHVDVVTSLPSGVTFVTTSPTQAISIGNLGPSEGFPVWVMRTTAPDTNPLANDGFTFEIQFDPIQ